MNKKILVFILVMLSCLNSNFIADNSLLFAEDNTIITDMCDSQIELPTYPERIACMHCVSPEKIMTLGKGGCISLMSKQSPWAYRLFPEINKAISTKGITPDQMLKMNIDLVLYTPGMTKGEQYSTAGLKTICAFSAEKRPMNLDDYMTNFKRQVSLFGEFLGPDAKKRAERYNRYFDSKVKQILAITSKINRVNRPTVYYGGLHGSILGSQGNGSVMHWNTEVAGGNFLPREINDNHAKATIAQVKAWDPDIILLSGYCDSTDIVTKDPDLSSLKAVKNGKVYRIPMGVYAWDHASNEGILLMIHLAKIFHPESFSNLDMIKEMKQFYSKLYEKNLTDKDLKRILEGLPPI